MQFYHQWLNSLFFFSDIESNIMPTIKLPGKRRKFHKLETDAKETIKLHLWLTTKAYLKKSMPIYVPELDYI